MKLLSKSHSSKIICALIVISLVLLVLVGCKKSTAVINEPIKILYSEWPPDLIIYLAQEKGFYKKYGANVELVQISDFEELFAKIANHEANIWPITLLDTVKEFTGGKDWQVILLEDYSEGADAILVNNSSDINNPADLRNKKVGVEKGTVGEFFLNIILNRDGLQLKDLEIVDLAFDEIPNAMASGEIDAGVTYEPSITQALSSGAKVLVDTKTEKNTIVDVFVADKTEIEDNKDQYIAVLNALIEAQEYFNKYPEESAQIMSVPFNITKEDLLAAFNNLRIPDYRENETVFSRTSASLSLFSLAKQAEQYMNSQGLIDVSKYYNMDSLISKLINNVKITN